MVGVLWRAALVVSVLMIVALGSVRAWGEDEGNDYWSDDQTGCKVRNYFGGGMKTSIYHLRWMGACNNGLADGRGILLVWWIGFKDHDGYKFSGSFEQGRIKGPGEIMYLTSDKPIVFDEKTGAYQSAPGLVEIPFSGTFEDRATAIDAGNDKFASKFEVVGDIETCGQCLDSGCRNACTQEFNSSFRFGRFHPSAASHYSNRFYISVAVKSTNTANGLFGDIVTFLLPGRELAKSTAETRCNKRFGGGCSPSFTENLGCLATASNAYGSVGWSWSTNYKVASDEAKRDCQNSDREHASCRLSQWACTYPAWAENGLQFGKSSWSYSEGMH